MNDNLILSSMPLDRRCSIINYYPLGIIAIDKATGIQIHPNKERKNGKPPRTLLNADYLFDDECYYWINNEGNKKRLYLTHRIDSPTSGIIIAAETKEISLKIKSLFKERKVKKTYYAIVRQRGKIDDGVWKDNLKENRANGRIRVTRGNGSVAITRVYAERFSCGKHGLAMLKMEPLTGRTHQLRVQCAIRGIPIIGDKSYGDFAYNRKIAKSTKTDRLCLHASEIQLQLENEGKIKKIFAESPLPRAMIKLLT